MKNITISVEDDLWRQIKENAADEHVSMNAFINGVLGRTVRRHPESLGERIATIAETAGPAPKAWKWNREEIYEDAI